VIARQRSLEAQLKRGPFSVRERFQPDGNYGYPTYLTGYRLAAQTRDLLNLDPEEPIESMRALVSDTLDIPLVQTKMGAASLARPSRMARSAGLLSTSMAPTRMSGFGA
jgi:hypothetical protein